MPFWKGNSKLDDEKLSKLFELREAGWTKQALADHFKVDISTVSHHLRKNNVHKPKTIYEYAKPAVNHISNEDFIICTDPVTGRELMPKEKINKGKKHYRDYLIVLAKRENKKIGDYLRYL